MGVNKDDKSGFSAVDIVFIIQQIIIDITLLACSVFNHALKGTL